MFQPRNDSVVKQRNKETTAGLNVVLNVSKIQNHSQLFLRNIDHPQYDSHTLRPKNQSFKTFPVTALNTKPTGVSRLGVGADMRWLGICLQSPTAHADYYMGRGVATNQMLSCLLKRVEYVT